jgi:predicted metal-binding membrane protein
VIGAVAADRGARRPDVARNFWFALAIGALVVASWLALWYWNASPYRRYVEHAGLLEPGALLALCRTIPQGEIIVPMLLHAFGWVLMIAAMMLPTTYPLLTMFRSVTRGRSDENQLTMLVIAGFFVAWLAFGIAAHLADAALTRGAQEITWLSVNSWVAGSAVLAAAGLFQFSALKYRCLEECRAPFAFVVSRWHGRSPAREAFRLGLDHGVFCVGCCWALMLCMFVVGTASIGWMLALAALMAAEKNLRGGARLRLPVGLGLLSIAGVIVAGNV